jgi:hypothetical protein
MGEFFHIWVSFLLQIKFLIARGTLCVLGADLTYEEDSANRLTFRTHACRDVFWGCPDYFLSLSASHG